MATARCRHVQLVLLGVDAAAVGIVARVAVDLSTLGRAGLMEIIVAVAALAGGILELTPLVVLAGRRTRSGPGCNECSTR